MILANSIMAASKEQVETTEETQQQVNADQRAKPLPPHAVILHKRRPEWF